MASEQASFLRRYWGDLSLTQQIAAATTTITDLIAVKNASYSIFIQKIIVTITTDAAQSLTLQDDASTPLVLAEIPTSPGEGRFEYDYGEVGRQLTEGKNLDCNLSAAGLVGSVIIQAYQRPTAAAREAASA